MGETAGKEEHTAEETRTVVGAFRTAEEVPHIAAAGLVVAVGAEEAYFSELSGLSGPSFPPLLALAVSKVAYDQLFRSFQRDSPKQKIVSFFRFLEAQKLTCVGLEAAWVALPEVVEEVYL